MEYFVRVLRTILHYCRAVSNIPSAHCHLYHYSKHIGIATMIHFAVVLQLCEVTSVRTAARDVAACSNHYSQLRGPLCCSFACPATGCAVHLWFELLCATKCISEVPLYCLRGCLLPSTIFLKYRLTLLEAIENTCQDTQFPERAVVTTSALRL